MNLVLVRHGQSQWNVDQTGGVDSPLTELGRLQARRVGVYLEKRFRIKRLYASPLMRARETAEIINSYLNLELTFEPDLREAEIEYGSGMRLFDSPRQGFFGNGRRGPRDISDYYASFQSRVAGAMDRILGENEDRDIAIVSHGGTMGTILRTMTGGHHFSVHTDNTGIHLLHWENYRWHLVAVNRVEHLLSEQDLVALPVTREHRRE